MARTKHIQPQIKRKVRLLRVAARGALHFTLLEKYKKRRRILITLQSVMFALVIFLTTILQTWLQISPPTYALSQEVKNIVGESRDDTKEYLKEDLKSQAYTFEAPEQKDTPDKEHTGRNPGTYSATLPKDAKTGVSFTDTDSKIDISLAPKFKTYPGQKVDGDHIVYLARGGVKLVYTLKYNGLKEDIILPHYMGDEISFDFELSLPTGVEARLDDNGNIGIYSSDPTLFGDISFGSDEDRARVDKARENGEKNNLVATIPFPLIKDASGQEYTDRSKFVIGKRTVKDGASSVNHELPAEVQEQQKIKSKRIVYPLSIESHNLGELSYPVSLDPTLQSSNSNNYYGVHTGDGVDIDMNTSTIKRSKLTGGALGNWNADPDTTLPQSGPNPRFHAYNGKLYYLRSGFNIQYATINSAGDLGSFVSTGVITQSTRHAFYNEFIYATWSNAWRVAKINENGSISAFTATTMHAAQGGEFEVNAYNGYIYLSGGGTTTGCPLVCDYVDSAAIQYAQIYADGTLSAWASAGPNFTGARRLHQMPIYNGTLYVMGGWQGRVGTEQTTANYARLNDDGTISSWNTTSATTGMGANTGAVYVPMSGYMYKVGGYDADANVGFAPINADGSLGGWIITTSLSAGRGGSGWATYNGRIYISGGAANSGGTQYSDILYTTPNPAGQSIVANWATTQAIPSNRYVHATVAHNGYIYHLGGSTGVGSNTNTVIYSAINVIGQLGTWSTTTSFTTSRFNLDAYAYNGYMYIFGGTAVSGSMVNQVAKINLDGTLGTWSNVTAHPLTGTGNNPDVEAVAINNYMYLLGGLNSTSEVYYSSINTDGTLGAWSSTNDLPSGVYGGRAIINGNRIYYVGGRQSGSPTANIHMTTINSNGTLGSWTTAGTINQATEEHGAVIIKNCLYVVGGANGSTIYNSVAYNCLAGNGNLTTWTSLPNLTHNQYRADAVAHLDFMYYSGGSIANLNDTTTTHYNKIEFGGSGDMSLFRRNTSIPEAVWEHSSLVYNNYLYIIGGWNPLSGGASVATVRYAPFLSSGILGTWQTTTALPAPRHYHQAEVHNGYMYVIAGYNSVTDTYTDEVLYAPINSNGTIGSWTTTTAAPHADGGHNTALWNGYLYIVGGYDTAAQESRNTVYYAPINTNGTVGSWTATTSLNQKVYDSGVTAYNGYIYSTGGYYYSTTLEFNIGYVEYASINTNGTLNTWNRTASFAIPRDSHSVVAYNGFIYIFGGWDADTNYLTNAQAAPILSDGTLGNFSKVFDIYLTRYGHETAVYNGRFYTTGGYGSGVYPGAIDIVSVQSMTRDGRFNRNYSLDQAVKPTSLITRGSKASHSIITVSQKSSVACSNNAHSNPQALPNVGFGGSSKLTIDIGATRTLAQCINVQYFIDDKPSATFPDTGRETTISEIDLYFIANPNQRLRGGKTFTNGVPRGLDAQP